MECVDKLTKLCPLLHTPGGGPYFPELDFSFSSSFHLHHWGDHATKQPITSVFYVPIRAIRPPSRCVSRYPLPQPSAKHIKSNNAGCRTYPIW